MTAPPPRSMAVLPIPSGATTYPGSPPVGGPALWSSTAAYAVNAQASLSNGANPEVWYNVKCITAVSAPGPNPIPISSFDPLVLDSSWVLQNNGEPAFVIGTIYTPGDVVSFGGAVYGAAPPLYMCVVKTAASPADQPASWKALATGETTTVESAPAVGGVNSGITVTEPSLGVYDVAANLSAASGVTITNAVSGSGLTIGANLSGGTGITVGSGTGTEKVVSLNVNNPVTPGSGITVSGANISANILGSYPLGVVLGVGTDTSKKITTSFYVQTVVATAAAPGVILPGGYPIRNQSMFAITPNTPMVDGGYPITWNLVWDTDTLQWLITVSTASTPGTPSFTFTVVLLQA